MHIVENNMGELIKAARLKKGLTQEKLAERVGVGLRHIMGIENEGSYPSFEVLYKLIRELNLSADSIFYPENNIDTSIQYLIRLLGRCDEREVRAITALVESLLESKQS